MAGHPGSGAVKATVHALANGKPMCGRPGQPGSWPPGERWVSAYDETGAWALDPAVSCPKCQYRLLARVGALAEARQQIPAARVGAAPDGPEPPPAYVCPTCGRASWNPNDAKHGYCGACGFQAPAGSESHSPGPWSWRDQDLVDCSGVLVAATHTCAADWNTSPANRALMAAAPELCRALRESLGLSGGCGSCEVAPEGRECDRCERARVLLRAIEGPT